jgi:hypothetical protein
MTGEGSQSGLVASGGHLMLQIATSGTEWKTAARQEALRWPSSRRWMSFVLVVLALIVFGD